MAIRAICFDFDGVLVDSEPIHWETWSEALKPDGITINYEDYCRRFIGVSNRDMIRRLCEEARIPFDHDRYESWYRQKRRLYRRRRLQVPLELVSYIKTGLDAYRLAVVSSSGRVEVEPYLVQSGIRERFDAVVCAEDVAELKPSPLPYVRAADLIQIRPEECLAVEDSDAGIESARGAGMSVLRVAGPSVVADGVRRALHPGIG
jgi:beta-phosphoglucomutase